MKISYRKLFVFLNCSFLIVTRRVEGVFLNLFMTNPLQVETDVVSDTDDRRFDQIIPTTDTVESSDRLRMHPKDIRTGSVTVSAGRLNDHGKTYSNCKEDRECQLGMYCDGHYGVCKIYRTMGQLCRRDAQCSIGYDCMFGRCLIASKPGHRGARCTHDRDCLAGLCCARQHGEKICKPKLKLGQNCFVPDGGLPYWGNDMCPCDDGLMCRYMAVEDASSTTTSPTDSSSESRSPSSADDWFNVWTDHNQMRCVES